jgi:hypothetical protein
MRQTSGHPPLERTRPSTHFDRSANGNPPDRAAATPLHSILSGGAIAAERKGLFMSSPISPNLAAQHDYVETCRANRVKFGLTVGDAFVRGIRDLGYKSNANALAELVDNSIQAGASRVDVLFNCDKATDKKLREIAVLDNGHGMEADMVRLAVMWGGTHREGDRSGMGRYGYGLPCSSVSVGRRFTVYSKHADGALHSVTIDLDEIGRGDYTDTDGEIIVPEPRPAALPKFVEKAIAAHYPDGWRSGTIVVIDKLDRLNWVTAGGLRENLLRTFGVTYHKLRTAVSIHVDGTYVDPIDPLFLTPGYRFYDLEGDEDQAHAFEPLTIAVKNPNSRETVGHIIVRFAWFPPTFASIDKRRDPDKRETGAAGKNANPRFAVMREFHGIIFSRMGRLVDVVARTPWTTFVNYDRFIKVEVEFPAELDEEFGITTSKQQITVSERIWDILKQQGVPKAIEQMRTKVKELRQLRKEAVDMPPPGQMRPAEDAMASAREHMRGPSDEIRARQLGQGEDKLRRDAEKRAIQTGRTPEEERQKLVLELEGREFLVRIESMPGGNFFRVDFLGSTKVLYLNRAHRFYSDVYSGPSSTPEVRAALEVLLLAIGDSILDAPEETARVYKVEVPAWSLKLDLALERLTQNVALSHDGDAVEPAWFDDEVQAGDPEPA